MPFWKPSRLPPVFSDGLKLSAIYFASVLMTCIQYHVTPSAFAPIRAANFSPQR